MPMDLVIEVDNEPGALAHVAAAISDAGVNIAAATCTGAAERAELHILVPHAEAARHSLSISHLAVTRERRSSSSMSKTDPVCSPISLAPSPTLESISIWSTSPPRTAWCSDPTTSTASRPHCTSPRRLSAMAASDCTHVDTISAAAPSDDGCTDCLAIGGRWVHLRRCAECGHVGCCDSSPNKHATAHFHATSHPIVQSFEPGEDWYWCYADEVMFQLPGDRNSPSHS